MNNTNGALQFDAVIRNTDFKKQIDEMERRIIDMANTTEKETDRMDKSFERVGSTIGRVIAGYFSVRALSGFTREIIRVRSEFQNYEASFKVFLGDAEKASQFMSELQGYAFNNVFEFKDLTQQAAQLLAFRHQEGDIISIIDNLSNIAAGANKPLAQLVDLYNKAYSQGKLMTDDIQQWQRSGVPVIQELAKQFNVTEKAMWEMVTAGTVGFKEIESVIKNLTSEGGMFYGMMEEKMKTFGDKIGLLQDNITNMFNELGESNSGILNSLVDTANYLVEHYQEIIDIILVLIATYGAYKAAVITTIAIQKAAVVAGNVKAWFQLARGIKSAKDARIAYNLATNANPWGLALAGITAAGIGIYKLATNTTKASEANKEFTATVESEHTVLEIMVNRLKRATEGTEEYAKAKKEIQDKYGEYLDSLNLEVEQLVRSEEAYRKLTQAIADNAREKIRSKYIQETAEEAAEDIAGYFDSIRRGLVRRLGEEAGSQLMRDIRDAIEADDMGLVDELFKTHGINQYLESGRRVGRSFAALVEKIKETRADLKDEIQTIDDILGSSTFFKKEEQDFIGPIYEPYDYKPVREEIDRLNAAIAETEKRLQELRKPGTHINLNAIEEEEKKLANLNKQLDLLTGKKGKEKTAVAPFGSIAYWDEVKSKAESAIKTLSPSNANYNTLREQHIKQAKDAQNEIDKLEVKSFMDIIDEKKKQYELYYKWVATVGKEVADNQFSELLENGDSYAVYLENLKKGITDNEQLFVIETQYKDITGAKSAMDSLSDSIKLAKEEANNLTDYLDNLSKIKNMLTSGRFGLVGDELAKALRILSEEEIKTNKELQDKLLKDYQTYEEKKLTIAQEYDGLIRKAEEAGLTELANRIKKQRDLILSELASDDIQASDIWYSLFNDMENMSLRSVKSMLAKIRSVVEKEVKDPRIKREIEKQLKDLEEKVAKSANVIESMFGNSKGAGFVNLFFGEGDLDNKLNSFKTIFSGVKGDMSSIAGNASELAGNAGEAAGAMQGMAGGAASALTMVDAIIRGIYQLLQGVTEMLDSIAEYQETIGNEETADNLKNWSDAINTMNNGVMGTWEKLKSGDVFGSMSSSLSWIVDMGSLFNKIHDKKYEKRIKEYEKAVRQLVSAYQDLERAVQSAIGDAEIDAQAKSVENLREQQKQLNKMINEERKKKNTDEDRIAEWEQQIKDIEYAIEDTYSAIADTLLQGDFKQWSDAMAEAITSAFLQGEDAAEAFGKTIDEIMLDIVKNQLKRQLLEPVLSQFENALLSYMTSNNNSIAGFNMSKWQTILANAGGEYEAALKNFEDFFSGLLSDTENLDNSLTGQIKGVTEDTANLIAGQMNAIRISQATAESLMKSQLERLYAIQNNTAFIEKIFNILNGNSSASNSTMSMSGTTSTTDLLRSQGLS